MKKTLLLAPIFTLLLPVFISAQATNPAVIDLSGGNPFSVNSYTGTNFPTYMTIGSANGGNGTFTAPIATDAVYGTGNGEWKDEGANGISYKGSGTGEHGSFLIALNTTGRMNVKVKWDVNDISVGTNTNFIELQYRVGSTGAFSDVNNDLYQQGMTPSGTSFSKTLPAATDDEALVYVRWIYYEVGTGSRSRLAIDNISLSTVVLPIELSRFDAQPKDRKVDLSWETATELNNDRFVVERSANGTDFTALESMPGAGTSTTPHTYRFTDAKPLPGRSYYRLQQVDFDGQSSFSPVRQVSLNNGTVKISPSLAISTLNATTETPFANDVRWNIFDASGRAVRSGVWSAETTDLNLQIDGLQSGNYFLNVDGISQQFVKQ